jgi:hypothetical protein
MPLPEWGEGWRDQAPKAKPSVRCCWVCGKPNACFGFTTALRLAGYRVKRGDVAHAHASCVKRALEEKRGGG